MSQPSSVVPKFMRVLFLIAVELEYNSYFLYCMKFHVISGIISDLNVRYPISFPYQLFPISQFSNPGVCVGDLAAHLDF